MVPFAIGVAAGLMILQGAITAPRTAFVDCLKKASLTAAAQQVAADQYSAFVAQQCSAAAGGFKNALINFDVKNGVKRAQAASDAQLQIDDYVAMSSEKYTDKVGVKPKAQPPQPPVQQAAQPKGN